MPFKSQKQRAWMYANKPEMAEKWEKETPKDANLPKEASVFASSFADELVKIAKTDKKKGLSAGAAGAAAGLGGIYGGIGVGVFSGEAAQRGMMREARSFSPELLEKIKGLSHVPVKEHEFARQGGGGVYLPKGISGWKQRLLERMGQGELIKGIGPGEQILVSRGASPSVVAHELGHAQFQKGIPGKLTQSGLARGLFGPGALIAGGVGTLAGRKIEDPKKGALVAAGVPAAIATPTLISEGAASLKGIKNLRAAGASPAQIAAAKRTLLGAFGTYGGKSLTGIGAGLLGYGIGRSALERAKKGKRTGA